jgi:hypothetical protein
MPGGERLHYLCQRWVTKSLPAVEAKFFEAVARAEEHIEAIRQHWHCPIAEATFYEFGAGWDMLGPLTFWGLGVERQVVIDIRRLLRTGLVNASIVQLASADFPLIRRPTKRLGRGVGATRALKQHYAIDYRAPSDARNTGLEANSVDCITSTDTLEHVPMRDIQSILAECRRIIRDDGIISFRIDYRDHYALFDDRISFYNFLQYSDTAWAPFSPSLHYQNRLRHRDYLELIRAAGFSVVFERRASEAAADLAALKTIRLSGHFAR